MITSNTFKTEIGTVGKSQDLNTNSEIQMLSRYNSTELWYGANFSIDKFLPFLDLPALTTKIIATQTHDRARPQSSRLWVKSCGSEEREDIIA